MSGKNVVPETESLLQISELAKRANVSIRTVRFYEEIGLFSPAALTSGGIRLYNQKSLNRLNFIRRLKRLGLGLEDIKQALGQAADDAAHRMRAEHTLQLLNLQNDKLEEEKATLSGLLEEVERSKQMVTRCMSCAAPACPPHCLSLAYVL